MVIAPMILSALIRRKMVDDRLVVIDYGRALDAASLSSEVM
ncbi:hypothetical protein SS05631_b52460 (plasmid) [Sinorhizobium sp. CCBAU 05631]|nr:hypothetical protein SS05631_b52460 [Sinorhizobium sp. CCBAU 05631]